MKNDWLSFIQQGESVTLEFKQSFDKETIETVCAFANTKGGQILIGITDPGQIKGVQVTKLAKSVLSLPMSPYLKKPV